MVFVFVALIKLARRGEFELEFELLLLLAFVMMMNAVVVARRPNLGALSRSRS